MAEIFNNQRVVGVRVLSDGATIHNNQPVVGIVQAIDGVLFTENKRVLGVESLNDDAAIYNDQPVLGVVEINDGRELYNFRPVIPVRMGGEPAPDHKLVSIEERGFIGTWAEAMDGPLVLAEPIPVSVKRQGFGENGAPTVYNETMYVTARLRQPYVDGIEGSTQNNRKPTTHDVVFSENVTSTDAITGVANNSTLVIPKPMFSWVKFPIGVVGNSATFGVTVGGIHAKNNKLAAAVRIRVTDGVTTLEKFITSPVNEIQPLTGYSLIIWQHTFDFSVFADGSQLKVHVKLFPWYGDEDSTYDSEDYEQSTFHLNVLASGSLTYVKHNGAYATPFYAYVHPTLGDDGTGVTSQTASTAKASPFKTSAAASAAALAAAQSAFSWSRVDGVVVRFMDDISDFNNAAVPTGDGVCRFEADPDLEDKVALTYIGNLGRGGHYKNLHMVRGGTYTVGNIYLEHCTYNPGSTTSASRLNSNLGYTIMRNVELVASPGAANPFYGPPAGTGNYGGVVSGVDILATANAAQFPACHIAGFRFANVPGSIYMHSSYPFNVGSHIEAVGGTHTGTTAWFSPTAMAAEKPIYMLHIMMERTTSTNINYWGISGDNQSYSTYAVAQHYCTVPGNLWARANNAYDDHTSIPRSHPWFVVTRSIYGRSATKGDIFAGVLDGSRQGSWWYEYQVGGRDNVFVHPFNFEFSYSGINSVGGSLSDNGPHDPLFADPQIPTSVGGPDGAGGGDYHVEAGSPAAGRDVDPAVGWDIEGNPRVPGGPVGAYGVLAE